jgi:hypothetical protein
MNRDTHKEKESKLDRIREEKHDKETKWLRKKIVDTCKETCKVSFISSANWAFVWAFS